MKYFAKRLKELRTKLGITIPELANKVRISQSSLYRYEQAVQIPRSIKVISLANFFNVKVSYLLGIELKLVIFYLILTIK